MTMNEQATTAEAMEGPTRAQDREQQPSHVSQYALVPFSFRNPFHDALRDATRFFPIADKRIRIDQGWKNDAKGGTSLGFGASVYDAAVMLSLYLDAHRDIVTKKRVIELGCGPGLVGIVAAHLNAAKVVITDGDPASMALTRRNMAHNNLYPPSCNAEEYMWGEELPPVIATDTPYDVILGADIVACPYASAFQALMASLRILTGPETLLLLAYKRRNISENGFFAVFKEEFDVVQVETSELHPDFQQQDEIVLFQARRKNCQE